MGAGAPAWVATQADMTGRGLPTPAVRLRRRDAAARWGWATAGAGRCGLPWFHQVGRARLLGALRAVGDKVKLVLEAAHVAQPVERARVAPRGRHVLAQPELHRGQLLLAPAPAAQLGLQRRQPPRVLRAPA